MGKSIEEILKQIESERIQRVNEEQSKIDQINNQRDLSRKEWNRRMKMYENLSNTSSPAAGAGGGGNKKYENIYIPPIPESGISLYYIRLTQGNEIVLDGFFYVNDLTHIVSTFYDLANPTVDILSTGNNGTPDYMYRPGWLSFSGSGLNITSLPYFFGLTTGDYNLYGQTSVEGVEGTSSVALIGVEGVEEGTYNATYAFSLTQF